MATADDTVCTLSNILSGILYRFRVTAITKEGTPSFPSDPSEPFVIDIPGVQVSFQFYQNFNSLRTSGDFGSPSCRFAQIIYSEQKYIYRTSRLLYMSCQCHNNCHIPRDMYRYLQ